MANFYRLDNCVMIMKSITRSLCKRTWLRWSSPYIKWMYTAYMQHRQTCNGFVCHDKFYMRFQMIIPSVAFLPSSSELYRELLIRHEFSTVETCNWNVACGIREFQHLSQPWYFNDIISTNNAICGSSAFNATPGWSLTTLLKMLQVFFNLPHMSPLYN